jgi:hypothetical protein
MLIIGSIFLNGCKDPCKDADCVNGICTEDPDDRKEAVCNCSAGYEGSNCSKGINAKLSGQYTVDETCTLNGQRSYTIEIAPKTGTTNQFILSGLYNLGSIYEVTAVMGTDGASFTIARQDHGSGFDIESNNGTLTSDGKSLTLTYTAYLNGTSNSESCSATITR